MLNTRTDEREKNKIKSENNNNINKEITHSSIGHTPSNDKYDSGSGRGSIAA